MKIVFCIDRMDTFGGAQRVISVLSNEMSLIGNEVYLFLTGNSVNTVYQLDKRIKVFCFNTRGPLHRSRSILLLRKEIKAVNPDVVISFLTMVNIIAVFATSFTDVKLVVSERNDTEKLSSLKKLLVKLFYRFADAVVVQTEEIKENILSLYKGKIYIIENPVNDPKVEKTDYNNNGFLVAVGRLNPQKNYRFMIAAMEKFIRDHQGYKLLIYGIGSELSELEKIVKEKKLDHVISFEGNKDNIVERELMGDIFLMTSDFEGMPNALAEAMSVGLPCISTLCDGGGAANLIDNGKNGLLIKKGDLEGFVSAMETLIDDRNYAKQLGEKAKLIKKERNTQVITARWIECIKSL